MKCKPINKLVVEQVLRTVSNEVAALCSRKNPSLLKKKGGLDQFRPQIIMRRMGKKSARILRLSPSMQQLWQNWPKR